MSNASYTTERRLNGSGAIGSLGKAAKERSRNSRALIWADVFWWLRGAPGPPLPTIRGLGSQFKLQHEANVTVRSPMNRIRIIFDLYFAGH